MSDEYTDPWDLSPEPDRLLTEWSDEWAEHHEWLTVERADRLERFSDPHGNSFVACVVCHERHGKLIYGVKCQPCFEAQRAEREAA